MDREIKLIDNEPNWSNDGEFIDKVVVVTKRSGITELITRINQFDTLRKEWKFITAITGDFVGDIVAYDSDDETLSVYNCEKIEINNLGVKFKVLNKYSDDYASTASISKEQIEDILKRLDADENLTEIELKG